MKFQIMQNLQITMTNFHLCYETNSTTKLGHPFSFGITIHSVQLNVKHTFLLSNHIIFFRLQKIWKKTKILLRLLLRFVLLLENRFLFQLSQIKGVDHLSIYWNTHCKSRLNLSFQSVIVHPKKSFCNNSIVSISFQDELKCQISSNDQIVKRADMNYSSIINFLDILANSSFEQFYNPSI